MLGRVPCSLRYFLVGPVLFSPIDVFDMHQVYYASDKDMVDDYELQVPLQELCVFMFYPRHATRTP